MRDFIERHGAKIKGTLSCFDRMIFRGYYLPLQNGQGMAGFLKVLNIPRGQRKSFLVESRSAVIAHAKEMAEKEGRPYRYLEQKLPMEEEARKIAAKDGIEQGLVCVFAILEPCRTFSFAYPAVSDFIRLRHRKCLHLYSYFLDREFGLIHLKLQTWFPMTMQVYINGQEWLARKLKAHGIGFTKLDNVFIQVEDFERAQSLADRRPSLDWPRILDRWTKRINPLMRGLLENRKYYWVTAQSEYATDVVFQSRQALKALYPRFLSHGLLCLGAKDVMGFLGRPLRSTFQGEITTDFLEMSHLRIPGARIKHRVKGNWLKMYDKAGIVLRVEMVINNPGEFRVRRRVRRGRRWKMEWVDMRKGVAYLFRYRDVSRSANSRSLDALAAVSDPTAKVHELERITRRRQVTPNRTAKAFHPLSREDVELFQAVMIGEGYLRGFKNGDIRRQLAATEHLRTIGPDERRRSAKVSRIFQRFHAHGLIAKIPHSGKWRTTRFGRRVMATAIQVRQLNFPQLLALAA